MAPLPLPRLTLRLSSPSFLETILTDASHPVYSTETNHNSTALSRCDPVHGLALVASIRWPEFSPKGKAKDAPPALVLMDGSLRSEDEFLRRNVLNTSRKFYVPGYSQSLKWKRVQGVFQCTSACGALVAVFEPAILTARARLNVFVQTLPGLAEPQGDAVSPVLTDFLIVTALLLLTHPEDWRGFSPSPLPHLDIPRVPAPSYATPVSPITSACVDVAYSPVAPPLQLPSPLPPQESLQPKEDVAEYEPPPPYEEIQWTVRVRQPRPRRT